MLPPGFSSWDEIDAINLSYYQANREKTLAQVLDAFQAVYEQALQITQNIPEIDLIDPQRFAWRSGEPIWHMVAANTFEHYEEHRREIEAWLETA